MRLGALFVAACMTVIAASAGAVVYFAYGFTGADAIIVAIAALTALALYNAVSTRQNVRSVVGPQLTELSRSGADLARQLGEMGRRIAVVEAKLERALAKGEAANEPLAGEISELGTLLDQLAETVAIHETRLTGLERFKAERSKPELARSFKPEAAKPEWLNPPAAAAPAAPTGPDRAANETAVAATAVAAIPVAAQPMPAPPVSAPVVTMPAVAEAATIPDPVIPISAAPAAVAPVAQIPAVPAAPPPAAAPAAVRQADNNASREMLAAIRDAIEANRIDLHLQPIVTLPQRKVRYYEAMSRLRTRSGDVVLAAEFISQAEAGGLMPKIDNLVAFRCVQVLRRLLLKNREIGVFCNLSVATLTDAVVFPQLLEFLDANRAIAPSLVLEFTQSGLRGAGPIETESLAALKQCGYHFSMDNVTDLRLEPRELASRGFRFVKLRANLILNRSGIATDIHPGDLPDLLARFGIDLIAEKIESEGSVVDLLDYDVKFGQGFLFSPPRPVRAEALQGVADRNDVIAREGAAPETKEVRLAAPEATKGLRSAGLTRLVRRV
jgi:cyclic-di-GMP phosphodiesterase, flagellum assembly factor TipF